MHTLWEGVGEETLFGSFETLLVFEAPFPLTVRESAVEVPAWGSVGTGSTTPSLRALPAAAAIVHLTFITYFLLFLMYVIAMQFI